MQSISKFLGLLRKTLICAATIWAEVLPAAPAKNRERKACRFTKLHIQYLQYWNWIKRCFCMSQGALWKNAFRSIIAFCCTTDCVTGNFANLATWRNSNTFYSMSENGGHLMVSAPKEIGALFSYANSALLACVMFVTVRHEMENWELVGLAFHP